MTHSSYWYRAVTLAALCAFALGGSMVRPLVAQQAESNNTAAGSGEASALRAGAVPIDISPIPTFLRNENGNLIAIPEFSFEEYEQFIRRGGNRPEADFLRSYTIEELSVEGVAGPNYAELDVVLRLQVHDDRLLRIPLGMQDARLRNVLQHETNGDPLVPKPFIDLDDGISGYVCRLQGKVDQQVTLRIDLVQPISHVGSESRLELSLPRSAHSHLVFRVRSRDIVVSVSDQSLLESVEEGDDGFTEIRALNNGGPLRLAWHPRESESTLNASVLEATGNILVYVEGQSKISTKARLRLRCFGQPVDRARIELPPNSRLLATEHDGYTAKILDIDNDPPEPKHRQIVEIQFSEKATPLPEVHLSTEVELEPGRNDDSFEVAGFNVVGAVRQLGRIALASTPDSYPEFTIDNASVRRVNERLPESLQHREVVAGFKYFRQPCSLKLRVKRRASRVSVVPTYVIAIASDRVEMNATFDVSIRGAEDSFFSVNMAGWEVDDVGPEALVNPPALDSESPLISVSPLLIGFKKPTTGRVEITVRAVQRLPTETDQIALELPQPTDVEALRAAVVVIIPDDNVQLKPRFDDIRGLVIDPGPIPPLELPTRRQQPFLFRGDDDAGRLMFVADMEVEKQSIVAAVNSEIRVHEGNVEIKQQIEYQIREESVSRLSLKLHPDLIHPGALDIRLDGQPVTYDVSDRDAESVPDGHVEAVVSLPNLVRGTCRLGVETTWPFPTDATDSSVRLTVPLVLPFLGKLTGHRLQLTSEQTMDVRADDDRWSANDADSDPEKGPGASRLTNDGTATGIHLIVDRPTSPEGESTFVEMAWIQTWLTRDQRYERAAFQLSTSADRVRLILPAGVEAGLTTRVDGKMAQVNRQSRDLDVHLSGMDQSHLVELWYSVAHGHPGPGAMQIDLPRVGLECQTNQTYWQLVVPRDEYLFDNPPQLDPETNWGWNFFSQNENSKITSRLEEQFGSTWRSPPQTSSGTNCYWFSSLGYLDRVGIRTVSQSFLLFTFGGVALIAGMLLIYIPVLRHPAILLCMAGALAVMAVRYPESAVMVSQATGFGLVFAVVGRVLLWFLLWRKRREQIVYGGSASSVERLQSDSYRQSLSDGAVVSTVTAPDAVPDSHSEVHR